MKFSNASGSCLVRKPDFLAGGLILLLMVMSTAGWAAGKLQIVPSLPSVLLNAETVQERDITSYLHVLIDEEGSLSLDEVRAHPIDDFIAFDEYRLPHSLASNTYWIHARIRKSSRDQSGRGTEWRLVLPSPHISESSFYLNQSSNESFIQVEPLEDRYLVFPIELDSQSTAEFYLKVKRSGGLNFPVRIWQEQSYMLNKRKSTIGWGLFFGSLAALFLYNLFVFVSLREAAYFYLSGFLCTSLLITAINEGFFTQYYSLGLIISVENLSAFFQCIALIFACAFSRRFLATKIHHAAIDRLLLATIPVAMLVGVLVLNGFILSYLFNIVFMVVSAFFFIPTVVAALQISARSSRFFLVGWTLFLLGFVIYQLGELNIIPGNNLVMRAKELALCLLAVFLSLGIAAQIQRERFAKYKGMGQQQETMLELKYAEEQIQKKVLRDTLQAFPGSDELQAVANKSSSQLEFRGESLTLVLVELLHLDRVESQLGHAARNELVTRATKRLSIVLRSIVGVMPIAEYGGQYIPMAILENGQYAFLLKGVDDVKVNFAVDEVEAAMHKPFFYQGVSLEPGVCFGVSRTVGKEESFETLYQHCCISLAADKNRSIANLQEFAQVDQYNPRNISLINQLREAIQEDKLTLFFQPTYAIKSKEVCGLEVLCRWVGANGDVQPSEIFYLAEVGGFVSELTLKVIEKAIQYYLVAVDISKYSHTLSVNLSPKCIREGRFMEQVALILDKYEMPGGLLSFEIKESAIIEDPSITLEALNHIRSLDIGLIIDDFGAAYSNPSYLSSLPVNEVKLDQRLIAQIENSVNYEAIVGVITLCREHHIKLVVHGVEDETTLKKLEQMGCGFAQGHYLAEPVQASEYRLPSMEYRKPRYLKVS